MSMKIIKYCMYAAVVLALSIAAIALTSCGSDEEEVEPEVPSVGAGMRDPMIIGNHTKKNGKIVLKANGCVLSYDCIGYSIELDKGVNSVTLRDFNGEFTDKNQVFKLDNDTVKIAGNCRLTFKDKASNKLNKIKLEGADGREEKLVLRQTNLSESMVLVMLGRSRNWNVQYSDIKMVDGMTECTITTTPK